MSNDLPVIQFDNVSKRFSYHTEAPQTVLEKVISFFPRRGKERTNNTDLWALKQIDFQVMPGQTVGIIGRNGSGKSTALKLMTRILYPTNGRVMVRGRVSALLELGVGFHPDLNGRDNIYLNGAILGLNKNLIASQYDKIVEFSELGDFVNMPVKHYSSGMYMRLGFSVAIHMNPDILIVDEILAVGDQAFQTKCMDRIDAMKQRGVTVIMVSHNLGVVRDICSHLIWLKDGFVYKSGPSSEIAEQYQMYSEGFDAQALQQSSDSGLFTRLGSREIEITAVRILDANGEEQPHFRTGEKLVIEIAYFAHKPITSPKYGLAIHRQDGVHITGPNTGFAGLDIGVVEGAGIVRYTVPSLPLLPARYLVTTAVHDSEQSHTYDHHERAYTFRVLPSEGTEQYGLMQIPAAWSHELDTVTNASLSADS